MLYPRFLCNRQTRLYPNMALRCAPRRLSGLVLDRAQLARYINHLLRVTYRGHSEKAPQVRSLFTTSKLDADAIAIPKACALLHKATVVALRECAIPAR